MVLDRRRWFYSTLCRTSKSPLPRTTLHVLTEHDLSAEADPGLDIIGNQGQAGIDAFSQQHQCNPICSTLGLDRLSPDTPLGKRPPTTISVLVDTATIELLEEEYTAWAKEPVSVTAGTAEPGA